MSLIKLWKHAQDQLATKQIQQIIGFAGDGRLVEKGSASVELREYLANVPTDYLERYATECLKEKFSDSGLALQDIANEVGNRLGFTVKRGRYRGIKNVPGFDGLWASPDNHSLVIEVKTTDTYRIDLDTIANYRNSLAKSGEIDFEGSSVLIIVGRDDTGDLEAQIRGSKHAWDMRLISVSALMKLLRVKESIETPGTEERVRSVLRPREFTRLDEIVDLVFTTSEEVRDDDVEPTGGGGANDADKGVPRDRPVNFYSQCLPRLQDALGTNLVKKSRISFTSPDGKIGVVCAVSKAYQNPSSRGFWFAFHPHQLSFLKSVESGTTAFACGSADDILLLPVGFLEQQLPELNRTARPDGTSYWHIHIEETGGTWRLLRKAGGSPQDLSKYRLD